jgi:uncharacterized protein (DUF2062 family)
MRHWLRKLAPDHAAIDDNRWLRPFRNTLLHPRLWHMNRRSVAGGVAAGLFFGLMPAPFQMLGAALCALVFRVNLPIAVLTTLYTNPLTFFPLYLFAWWIGQRILGGDAGFVPPPEFDYAALGPWLSASLIWLGDLGTTLALGVLLLASAFACIGYFGVRAAWRIWLVRHWRRRRLRHIKAPVAQ